ncbi:MAG: putative Ig domain-containing protein, partial [Sphingobacteriales bacterium]|nr:putative Ig domain-containing protein [Sphingobacteriales bacterium]
MKRNPVFNSIYTAVIKKVACTTLLVLFVFINSMVSYAQKADNSFPLGKTTSFLQTIQQKIAVDNVTGADKSVIRLRVSPDETFDLNVNVTNKRQNQEEDIIGNIDTLGKGTFLIRKDAGDNLSGHIVFTKTHKAFQFYSDKAGNAFIREADINKIVCVNYNQSTTTAARPVQTSSVNGSAVLNLQSFPKAMGGIGCVLLDFDGQYVAGTVWNGGVPITALPASMTDAQVKGIWELISEDYRAFNLNITTSEAVYNTYPSYMRMRCIFTPTKTVAPTAGGIAYVGSFSWNDETPCWSFETGINGGQAASHEIGHTLGLRHDGRELPTGHEEYFAGLSSGNWGPIMGTAGYYKTVSQWSKGEYQYASNQEDDLAIMSGYTFGLGYKKDDYGNSYTSASPISITSVVADTGIISTTDDIDFFNVSIPAGTVSLAINGIGTYSNLDILVKLYNSSGNVIRVYNPAGLNVAIDTVLNEGNYYLSVEGTGYGDPFSGGYSKYASLGKYFITGIVPSNSLVPVVSSGVKTSAINAPFNYQIISTKNPTSYTATGLPAGVSLNTLTGVISGTPTAGGTFVATIAATNAAGTGYASLTMVIVTKSIITTTAQLATVGSYFSYAIIATESPVSYTATGLPPGLVFNTATGIISGTPTVPGIYTVTVSATNIAGSTTGTLTITIKQGKPIIYNDYLSEQAGIPFSYTLSAYNNPVSYAVTNLPAGLTFDTSTHIISGKIDSIGSYYAVMFATNDGGTDSATLTIYVTEPIPVLTTVEGVGKVGVPFTYALSATNNPTSYTASGLPPGLQINTQTGVISGTPTTAGYYYVQSSATNDGGIGRAYFIIYINTAASTPPVVASAALTGVVGVAFTKYTSISPTPVSSYQVDMLPPGLMLISTNNQFTITGVPTAAGTYTCVVTGSNYNSSSMSLGVGVLTISISSGVQAAPVINTIPLQTSNLSSPFNCVITATNA